MNSYANKKVCMTFREWLRNESPCPQGMTRAEQMGMTLSGIWAQATRPSDMLWLVYRMPSCEWASRAINRVINEHCVQRAAHMAMHHDECVECCDAIRNHVPIESLPPFVGKFLSDRQQATIRRMLRDGEL